MLRSGGLGLLRDMLTFDSDFHSDDLLGCVLWASETLMGHVRFDIGSLILQDILHDRNTVA